MSNTPSKLRPRPGRTDTRTFPTEPDDSTELNRLRQTAAQARRDADAEGAKAAARTAATKAEAAVDDFLASVPTVTFHLRSCGPKWAEKIQAKHPPTPEQQEKHAADLEAMGEKFQPLPFDPDEFPPRLIARCVTRVVYTGDQPETVDGDDIEPEHIMAMFDEEGWSSLDAAELMFACQMLFQGSTALNRDLVERLGKG